MTSELSNALNPHVVQNRRRRSAYTHREQNAPVHTVSQLRPAPPQPSQPSTRHRSELELAVVEPPPPPPRPPAQPKPQAPPKAAQAFQQLAHAMIATKHAADQERNRRIAWEQEQEAKYMQRQAELEQQLATMQSEMSLLKAVVTMQQQPPYSAPQAPTISQNYVSGNHEQTEYQPPFPAQVAHIEEVPVEAVTPPYEQDSYAFDWQSPSPTEQSPTNAHPPPVPAFEEGCSSRPRPAITFTSSRSLSQSPNPMPSPRDGWMLSPSPSAISPGGDTDASSSIMSPSLTSLGKRRTPPRSMSPTQSATDSSADESDVPTNGRPRKRRNGHDSRCLTIQAAIRKHIFYCMETEPNEPLPESHVDGTPIDDDEPVRFDWSKTARKSNHNSLMKARVVKDLKANRKLYKHVPEKDFSDKTLNKGFDQAFTTLRQKFQTQQDDAAALHNRLREDQKSMKARRKDRKKTKLATRTASRTRLPIYAHTTFDGALQLDCMSSEESEPESASTSRAPVLRIRSLPWRSTRLQRLYAALDAAAESAPPLPDDDDDEQHRRRRRAPAASANKTKERRMGPPKDGLHLPPRGVSSWMVSRRWVRDCVESGDVEVGDRVKALVEDSKDEGFDWGSFSMLGDETDDEPVRGVYESYIPRSDTSYALANALQAPL